MASFEMQRGPEEERAHSLPLDSTPLEFNEGNFEEAVMRAGSLAEVRALLHNQATIVKFTDYRGEEVEALSIFSSGKRFSVDKYIQFIDETLNSIERKEALDLGGLPIEPEFLVKKIEELARAEEGHTEEKGTTLH
jgi:hypothetical protein